MCEHRPSCAVDKSPDALANSWRALSAMEFLHNVTRPFSTRPGFVARTAVRCGEPHQGPSGGVCSKGCKCPPHNASCPGCSPPPGECCRAMVCPASDLVIVCQDLIDCSGSVPACGQNNDIPPAHSRSLLWPVIFVSHVAQNVSMFCFSLVCDLLSPSTFRT